MMGLYSVVRRGAEVAGYIDWLGHFVVAGPDNIWLAPLVLITEDIVLAATIAADVRNDTDPIGRRFVDIENDVDLTA